MAQPLSAHMPKVLLLFKAWVRHLLHKAWYHDSHSTSCHHFLGHAGHVHLSSWELHRALWKTGPISHLFHLIDSSEGLKTNSLGNKTNVGLISLLQEGDEEGEAQRKKKIELVNCNYVDSYHLIIHKLVILREPHFVLCS